MNAKPQTSATTARLAYKSAIQAELDYAIAQLETQGAEMLLDPDFTEMLVPHLDGTHRNTLTTDPALCDAITRALYSHLRGIDVTVANKPFSRLATREVRVAFWNGAEKNLSKDEKEFLWEALTNLSVGGGNANLRVSLYASNLGWVVSPLSRDWLNEAFGGE